MKVNLFVNSVKERISNKNILIQDRNQILERVKKGKEYILKIQNTEDKVKLNEAVSLMTKLLNELVDVENKILDIDIILVTELEAFLSDFVARVSVKNKMNQAGDIIDKRDVYFVAQKDDDSHYVEISPEDLWYLKLIKQAIGINNIEIISKEQYYKQ